ncbi:MAG: dihydroorotase [Actinomycetota bacterium]
MIDPIAGCDQTADVLVGGGRILEVGKGLPESGASIIDISGAVICPGFVDLHVHLREPGREDEETIASGSAAAAAGGFTAICAMPNTDPVCDSAAIAEMVASEGARAGLAEVIPAGAITQGLSGNQIAAVGEMAQCSARVIMFTDDGKGVADSRLLRRAMEYIKGFGGICAEHCEDAALSQSGQMHEGEFSDLLGLKGIPAEAEEVALGRDLALAKLTGVHFHALHVSTAGSVDLIRRAKALGIKVTAEAAPHHLTLTDSELVSYDPNFKMNPPLRSPSDVEALREGLVDGTIDAIATDHAPHALEEKEAEFELAPPGIVGLETALAVVITELVDPGIISLAEAIRLMSCSPAAILKLKSQGGPVAEGGPANLTIFDPQAEWVVDPALFASKSRNSPWAGRALRGRVLHTVFSGKHVFDHALGRAVV